MRRRWVLIAAVAMATVGYAAYPFVTLYQLESAVRDGDALTLADLVDWYSVREGIKEDICDLVLEEGSDVAKKGLLPAFGASFVRGVTGSSVDREFTPEKLANIGQPDAQSNGDASIGWAFFSAPARFIINVKIVGQTEPVRAEMALAGLRWKVTRVWIPETLLKQGHWAA
jgi:hypothetical protein